MRKPDTRQSRLLQANYETLKALQGQPVSISTKVVDEEVVFVLRSPLGDYTIAAVGYEDSPWADLQITKVYPQSLNSKL